MSKIFQVLLTLSLVLVEPMFALPNAYVSWQNPGVGSTTIPNVDSVSFIDTISPYAEDTYPLADDNEFAFGIDVTPDGKKVYVGQRISQLITVLDGQTGSELNSFTVSIDPGVLRMTPDGKKCYVVGRKLGDGLAIIDTATDAVTYVSLNDLLLDIAFTPDGKSAYISIFEDAAASGKGGFHVMNTANNVVTATILDAAHFRTQGVAISPDGKTAYFAIGNSSAKGVYLVNTASNSIGPFIDFAPLFPPGEKITPYFIAITPDGKKAFVTDTIANLSNSRYFTIDLSALTAAVELLLNFNISINGSRGLAITPDGTKVFMTHDLSVSVIDAITNAILDSPIIEFPVPELVAIPRPVSTLVASVRVRGCSNRNQFLSQTEVFNTLVWDSPTTVTPVRYEVYRDAELTCLAGEVTCPQFTDHNRQRNASYSYYIVAVLSDGSRVLIGQTTVCAR